MITQHGHPPNALPKESNAEYHIEPSVATNKQANTPLMRHRCGNCWHDFMVDSVDPGNCPKCGAECFRANNGVNLGWVPDSYLLIRSGLTRLGVFAVRGGWQWWIYLVPRSGVNQPVAKGDIFNNKQGAIQEARFFLGLLQKGIQFDESFQVEEDTHDDGNKQ